MDLQEVEKYRAIPRGGLKLLVFPVLLLLWVGAIWVVVLFVPGDLWVNEDAVNAIIFLTVALFMSVFFPLFCSHPIKWLRDYWRRNVRGCSIAVFKDDAGNCQMEGPYTREIIRTGMWPISLILPLGGWFNRAYILCAKNYVGKPGVNADEHLSKWRVELVALHVHTEAVTVRLVDRLGDRVTVSAKDALEILERFSARLEGCTNTWDAVVSYILIAERVRTAERDEAQHQLKDAIAQIVGAVDHLDATKRFIKSKQAQAIRRGLVCELNRLLPPDDPRREKYILATTTRCTTGLGCCEAIPIAPI